MDKIAAYKGIAPGAIIARELTKRKFTQRELSDKTGIHYQTINAIIYGKRALTISQSLKLDKALHFENGFFAVIQAYYQVKQLLTTNRNARPIPVIRPCVFWDIDINTLDWNQHKVFILSRVHERGNHAEIEATNQFYGL